MKWVIIIIIITLLPYRIIVFIGKTKYFHILIIHKNKQYAYFKIKDKI